MATSSRTMRRGGSSSRRMGRSGSAPRRHWPVIRAARDSYLRISGAMQNLRVGPWPCPAGRGQWRAAPSVRRPIPFPTTPWSPPARGTRKTRAQIAVPHRSASFQHVLPGGTSFRFFLAVDQTYDSLSISPSCAFSRGPRDSPPFGWSRGRTAPDSRYRPCPLSRGRFPLRSGWPA